MDHLAAFAADLATVQEQDTREIEQERMTLEFSQPLVQTFRRHRPRRRGARTPLFEPKQLKIQED